MFNLIFLMRHNIRAKHTALPSSFLFVALEQSTKKAKQKTFYLVLKAHVLLIRGFLSLKLNVGLKTSLGHHIWKIHRQDVSFSLLNILLMNKLSCCLQQS